MKTLFFDYLKGINAYDVYVKNTRDFLRETKSAETIDELLEDLAPYQFIPMSFPWHKSPEGFRYWAGINQGWNEAVRVETIKRRFNQ